MFQTSQLVETGSQGQDRVLALRFPTRMVLAIADGAGGCSGGVEAAELMIQLTKANVAKLDSQAVCEALLTEIDRAILKDAFAGETTGVLAVVEPDRIFGASVGDSVAWLIADGVVDDLSRHQWRKPCLGTGIISPFGRTGSGGTLLLATDGLVKYTSRELICKVVTGSDLEATPHRLIELVRYSSGA